MSAIQTLVRLARRRAEELQRELGALENQRRAIEARLVEHDRIVASEQALAAQDVLSGFGNFAQAAHARKQAILKEKAIAARDAEALRDTLADAFIELKKLETLAENEAIRAVVEADKRDQAVLDDLAAGMARRR
jgi:flagellar export protein FliJ